MSVEDLPNDGNAKNRLPLHEVDAGFKIQLNELQDLFKTALHDVKIQALAKAPHVAFEKYFEVKSSKKFDYPKANDDMLQMVQYYSQRMINALRAQASSNMVRNEEASNAYHAAAGVYSTCLEAIAEHVYSYDSDKTQELIDTNADWFVDMAELYDQPMMAAKAVNGTLQIQDVLIDKRVSEREEMDERKKGLLIARKRQEYQDRTEMLDGIDARTIDFVRHTAAFIKQLPHTTKSGLEEELYDESHVDLEELAIETTQSVDEWVSGGYKTPPKRTVVHTYSYAHNAGCLYRAGIDILRRLSPQDALVDYMLDVQPDLALTQSQKFREFTVIDEKTGMTARKGRINDVKSAVDGMKYSLDVLHDKAPERLFDFISNAYLNVSEELIEFSETAAAITLYESVAAVSGEGAQIREAFAKRNVQQMLKQGDVKEAGWFLNSLYAKSKLPKDQALILLNENSDGITAASIPLFKNKQVKARATIIYNKDAAPAIIYERTASDNISYSARSGQIETKNQFAQQAEDVAKKIAAGGLDLPHTALSRHWRAIECNKI